MLELQYKSVTVFQNRSMWWSKQWSLWSWSF